MAEPKAEEHVLCVPRSEFDAIGAFQGVTIEVQKYLPLLQSPNLSFQPRSTCETDPTYKQIIPYHLVIRNGKILEYVRTKKSGEQRLATKRSIGIGGHINLEDHLYKAWQPDGPHHTGMMTVDRALKVDPGEVYCAGEHRELEEELTFAAPEHLNLLQGFINDDEDEVGRVHLGVIHLISISALDGVYSSDEAIELRRFALPSNIMKPGETPLEGWSSKILDSDDFIDIASGLHGERYPFFK